MPTGLRWLAEYQPFTPVIDTVRGLLLGTAIGDSATIAVVWCVAITVVSYLWARALFNRPRPLTGRAGGVRCGPPGDMRRSLGVGSGLAGGAAREEPR
jgi:hypothetical protein